MGGHTFFPNLWPRWLTSLFPSLKPKRRRRPDDYDYDLPPPRLYPDRLPITRPSSPCLFPASQSHSAVPSLDYVSAPQAQPQAHLIKLLPLEIRQKIWSLILGGYTLHLEIVWDRLGCVHCTSADPCTCDGQCARRGGEWIPDENGNHRPPLTAEAGRPLRLLTTCRQVYTEAIDILYSSNTFTISNPATMEYLPLTLLPERLATIRTLRFYWTFYGPPPVNMSYWLECCSDEDLKSLRKRQEVWRNIWRIMSAMTGLRRLHVKLCVTREWVAFNQDSAAELLEPVKQVTQPDSFLLSLPFPAMYEGMPPVTRGPGAARNGWEGSDPWDDLPNCKIRRVGTIREL